MEGLELVEMYNGSYNDRHLLLSPVKSRYSKAAPVTSDSFLVCFIDNKDVPGCPPISSPSLLFIIGPLDSSWAPDCVE